MKRIEKPCAVDECPDRAICRGWCSRHYDSWRRHGDPLTAGRRKTQIGDAERYYLAHIVDETDECFPWPFSKVGSRGYGRVYIDGRPQRVHVLACEYAHGPRPPGLQAIHGPCGAVTGECWNPRHVNWGTRRKNQLDRHRDGRDWLRGEATAAAKLTEAQALEALARFAGGETDQTALAADYGVQANTINGLVNGRSWAHLPRPGVPGVAWRSGEPIRERAKLTEETATEILARVAAGETNQAALAREYGVKKNTINGLITGKTWKGLPRPPRMDGRPWLQGEPIRERAKMTEAVANEILARYAAGERTPRALAAEFGVHRESIRGLVAGNTWRHLPRPA